MQTFTGWQYLLIDLANQFGHDKLTFEKRIEWAEKHLHELEALVGQAETQPLYVKAMMAIRKAQKGQPTGHMVGFDASCSGIQIMSAMTGCVAGATATGLVDPNVRADAYTSMNDEMNKILGGAGIQIPRADAKAATMHSFYGSKKTPRDLFGKGTPALAAFYQAAMTVAPGAWDLLQDLLASWQPYTLVHEWDLPDGYHARIKVMEKVETRIAVDELDKASFTYEYYINKGSKKGLSNAANVVHSVDAYLLRSLHRRCNYDVVVLERAHEALKQEMYLRDQGFTAQMALQDGDTGKLAQCIHLWERTNMPDVVIFPYVVGGTSTQYMATEHIAQLLRICERMQSYKAFEVVTVHDEFKCHPNNMNHLRQTYIDIMAEIAESTIIDDILSQIHGMPGSVPKLSTNLGQLIRGSNYALC